MSSKLQNSAPGEADEDDIVSEPAIHASPAPDIVVSGLTWWPRDIEPGDTVVFTAAVENLGTSDAEEFSLWAYLHAGEAIESARPIPVLRGGKTTVQYFVWSATSGEHEVRVVADGPDAVAELDEDNNSATFSVPAR